MPDPSASTREGHGAMDDNTRATLKRAAAEHQTPAYVYFVDQVRSRFELLDDA